MNKILFLFVLCFLAGCARPAPVEVGVVEGLKPVYISSEENIVEVQAAKEFENLGKIVYAAPYLMINEQYRGIHVLDNTNPADPIKIAFIQIPGNTDFTLKGQYLYANHGNDLKTFLIGGDPANLGSSIYDIEETQIIPNFFADAQGVQVNTLFPPGYTGFFECVDAEKGDVVAWEETTLLNPECSR